MLYFQPNTHIMPAELATNPAVHVGAIGATLAVIAGALPAIAAVMPIIYYSLLITDHLIGSLHRRRHRNKPRSKDNEQ